MVIFMVAGGFSLQYTDPVANLWARLEQALPQAGTGALSGTAFSELYRDEANLESALVQQAKEFYGVANFEAAAQMWTTVSGLNNSLVTMIGLMSQRPPADGPDGEDLAKMKKDCADLSAFAQAMASMMSAISKRISSNLTDAVAAADEARRLFESLAQEGSEGDAIMAMMAEGVRIGAVAGVKQLRFQFKDASLTYLEAKKTLEKARARFVKLEDADAATLAGIESDINGFKRAAEQSAFMGAIADGNFKDAAQHAGTIIKDISGQDDENLLPFIREFTKFDLCNMQAYLSYARAEVAGNGQNWEQALKHLARADEQWRQAVAIAIDMDIPQSRQIAESVQAASSQVIGSCQRRISRERELYAEIARLKQENRQLQESITSAATAPAIGRIMGDEYKIKEVGQAASIGSHNKVSGTHMEQVNEANPLSGVDMPVLARQLEELLAKLKESAADPDQYAALAEVGRAAGSAKDQDQAGTLQHLSALGRIKQAGQWVLAAARDIGVEVAAAVVKSAIGVP